MGKRSDHARQSSACEGPASRGLHFPRHGVTSCVPWTRRTLPPLRSSSLVKRYKAVAAVDGISFRLPPGSITGLLGGNGAGKTTTIAMIMGLVTPTSGTRHACSAPTCRASATACCTG